MDRYPPWPVVADFVTSVAAALSWCLTVCGWRLATQISSIILERKLLDAGSELQAGSSKWTKVECILSQNRVRAFENGRLRMDRDLPEDNRDSLSVEAFEVSQNRGSYVGFEIRSVSITEQTTPRSVPSFCPATGNFYQVWRGASSSSCCYSSVCVRACVCVFGRACVCV